MVIYAEGGFGGLGLAWWHVLCRLYFRCAVWQWLISAWETDCYNADKAIFFKFWPKSQSLTMALSAQCYYNHTDLKTKSSFLYIDCHTDTQMLTEQLESFSHLLVKCTASHPMKLFYHNHLHMFISLVAKATLSHNLHVYIFIGIKQCASSQSI